MKKSLFIFLLFFLSELSLAACPSEPWRRLETDAYIFAEQPIGSVVFSWDQIGETKLVISYKGEEIHPQGLWHKHAGGYESKEAKKFQEKVITQAKRMTGRFYRYNKIKFTFWDYIKSFFVSPIHVKTQKFILYADGSEKTVGLSGKIKDIFIRESRNIFDQFQKLQELRRV